MNRKLLLVMNPNAGTRLGRKHLPEIVRIFSDHGYFTTVYITEKPGDGAEVIRDRGGEFDIVACSGGDGTFNEAVAGIMGGGYATPLGYIPAGSTNDFATSLHLSTDILKAAEDIVTGRAQTLDVGRFNSRYFSYTASFGAFTKSSYSTPQNIKNALGHLAYILEGIRDIPSIHPEYVKIEADGKIYEGNYLFGAVCNSTSLGGILTLDPSIVDMNDGIFETILIKAPSTAMELQMILSAVTTHQYECEMIDFIRSDKICVTASPEMDWSLDGEFERGSEAIEISNVHSAIQLMINSEANV